MGKVETVEVVSDRVARFVLSAPDSALLESLAQPWTAIQSPAGIARGMDANCQAPIGTGPFIVDEWVKQDHVSLVRNDDYASAPADAGTHRARVPRRHRVAVRPRLRRRATPRCRAGRST